MRAEITEEIAHHLGALLCVRDNKLRERYERVVKSVWSEVDQQELQLSVHIGDFCDIGGNLVATYAERAIKLRPFFISRKPEPEIACSYREATVAWLHGLDCAALILCCSVIKRLVRETMRKIDPRLLFSTNQANSSKDLDQLLKTAKRMRVMELQTYRDAESVRRLRNKATHKLTLINEHESYDAMLATKRVIEQMLSRSQR